jgi:DNA-binding CsgD family transcriptional regulator
LTPREQEVLQLLQQGLSNEQIAERLNISLAGAKFHVSEIISRLGVESRYEAAAWQPAPSRGFGLAPILGLFRKASSGRIFTMAAKAALGGAALALILLAVGVAVMASRHDDDSLPPSDADQAGASAEERLLPPENAAEVLQGALLSPADFPDEIWTITMEGDTDNERVTPAAVCDPLRAVFALAETDAIAQSTREITNEDGIAVEINLIAFPTTDGAEELMVHRREMTDEQFAACLTENIKRQRFDNDALMVPALAPTSAPHGGEAFGGDAEFKVQGGTRVAIHGDIFTWTQGNVAAYVIFIAQKSVDMSQTEPTVLTQIASSINSILE